MAAAESGIVRQLLSAAQIHRAQQAQQVQQVSSGPGDAPAVEDLDAWWKSHLSLATRRGAPADLALAAGFAATRPAWAFLSGYQAALRCLVPRLSPGERAAFAATEEAGNHPRAIATTLSDSDSEGAGSRVLAGVKTFVTLGPAAEVLLVLATRGLGEDGRPDLALVQVPRGAAGVSIDALPPLPFIPEVVHGRAVFDDVVVAEDAVHPGDGYADYSKPFRTLEDAHVHGALVAYFLRLAVVHGAPPALIAELASLAAELHRLAGADPRDPFTHVVLAAALSRVVDAADDPRLWAAVDDETRALWDRDRPILSVAAGARARRLVVALGALGAG